MQLKQPNRKHQKLLADSYNKSGSYNIFGFSKSLNY